MNTAASQYSNSPCPGEVSVPRHRPVVRPSDRAARGGSTSEACVPARLGCGGRGPLGACDGRGLALPVRAGRSRAAGRAAQGWSGWRPGSGRANPRGRAGTGSCQHSSPPLRSHGFMGIPIPSAALRACNVRVGGERRLSGVECDRADPGLDRPFQVIAVPSQTLAPVRQLLAFQRRQERLLPPRRLGPKASARRSSEPPSADHQSRWADGEE